MNSRTALIELNIHDVNKTIFNGMVKSISSINKTGPFDILPEHTNFISIISNYIQFQDINKKKYKIDITKAVLRCKEGKVDIYTGVDQLSDQNLIK